MNLGAQVRRTCFWVKDALLHKGQMRRDYLAVKRINDNADGGRKETEQQLEKLLCHAADTTQFYAAYKGKKLEDFPVINKQTILERELQMRSSLYTKDWDNLHKMTTSGSTGIPFAIRQNPEKRRRVIAEIKAVSEWAGYYSHEKMLYIFAITKRRIKPRRVEFLENIYRMAVGVNDEESLKMLVDFLIYKKPVAIHASASSLVPLAQYILSQKIPADKFSVHTIITGGEMVPEKLREELQICFGNQCRICAKYSNEEMGILGQDDGIGTPYRLNWADYYFEILKVDSDEPCAPGELGRIVITDLYNFALPMIRYDTGDIGALGKEDRGWPVLVQLSGKRRDLIYDTQGAAISGAVFTNLLKKTKNVRMWQIIQTGAKSYKYRVVPESDAELSDEDVLLQNLYSLLGEDAQIKVEISHEIPTIQSGKRRYTVNEYIPQ